MKTTHKRTPNGGEYWCLDAPGDLILHREDGPARIDADGSKEWHWNGLPHRIDGPALERADGYREWRLLGRLHRLDGPAIIDPNGGVEQWLQCHELHREDGPAFIGRGASLWYLFGLLHRIGGPAITEKDGTTIYYENGVFLGATKPDGTPDLIPPTDQEMVQSIRENMKF